MTRARRRAWRIALVFAIPLAVVVLGRLGASFASARTPESIERDLTRQADLMQERFTALLRATADAAARAAERSPYAAIEDAPATMRARLEGAGRVGADGEFDAWNGTPGEPSSAAAPGALPGFSLRTEGLWSRLDVTSPVRSDGSYGLATLLLDAPTQGFRFSEALPRVAASHSLVHVDFVASAGVAEDLWHAFEGTNRRFQRGTPSRLFVLLTAPAGEVLVSATLQEVPKAQREALRIGASDACAAVAFALLLGFAFPWGRSGTSLFGYGSAIAAVWATRVLLLVADAPAALLPRAIATPALYGSSALFGLLASPADLFLTGIALVLSARAAIAYAGDRRGRAGLAVVGAGASLAVVVAVAFSLARDASVPLLPLTILGRSSAFGIVLIGFALTIVAAADWLATLGVGVTRGATAKRSGLLVAATLLPVAVLATVTLIRTEDRLVHDRLRSELGPQVLAQESRRAVSLLAAVKSAAESDDAREVVQAEGDSEDSHGAYLLWAAGDLFHSGYQSSLDLYDAEGARRSRFGFSLPALDETVVSIADAGAAPVVRKETIREGGFQLEALHADAPILRAGAVVGTVVGHVLDEPDNLPFLATSFLYLAALGPGEPGGGWDDPWNAPAYVLYDATDAVVVSTLDPPPPARPELRAAALTSARANADAGNETYSGIALPGANGALHFLAVPARTLLDGLGAFARLCLVSLAALLVLEALAAGTALLRPLDLLRSVRASFRRKLLASVLAASLIPVLGLTLWVRGYVERRSEAALVETAGRVVSVVKRVVEDYATRTGSEDAPESAPALNDEILQWLRRVVGQEIHVYEAGRLLASSKRELFSSGLLPARLPGAVIDEMTTRGRATVVLPSRLGSGQVPVAYARIRLAREPAREGVAAVPLVLEEREARRAVDRVGEVLLLASALLTALLTAAAAVVARTVARPVGALVDATRRIASGDYGARLASTTSDEIATLVEGFNRMASALAAQRADLVRRREYMEALLRNATLGVLSTDAAGRIVTQNPAAEALLFGVHSSRSGPSAAEGDGPDSTRSRTSLGAEVTGRALVELVLEQPGLAPLADALRAPLPADGEPQDLDVVRSGATQRLRVVRVRLPDPEGGAPGTLLLLDDVTDLMRSNQLAAWSEMAQAIAHEIKNPLTPIQLSIEHLGRILRDRGTGPAPEVEACLETVRQQVRALRQIASEFSAYAKLPDLERVPTDVGGVMREAIAAYRVSPPKGVTIEESYAHTPPIAVDRRVLSRAIINLVENALEAMRASGGTLRVEVGVDPSVGAVVLSIADTGPGIPDAVRRRLFEPYFSTKSSGTGLGLSIVRRAAEAHGGTVEVASAAGAGATFRIRIPLRAAPAQ